MVFEIPIETARLDKAIGKDCGECQSSLHIGDDFLDLRKVLATTKDH